MSCWKEFERNGLKLTLWSMLSTIHLPFITEFHVLFVQVVVPLWNVEFKVITNSWSLYVFSSNSCNVSIGLSGSLKGSLLQTTIEGNLTGVSGVLWETVWMVSHRKNVLMVTKTLGKNRAEHTTQKKSCIRSKKRSILYRQLALLWELIITLRAALAE